MINQELLKVLQIITKEEQDILDGKTTVDQTLYMADADGHVITSRKLMEKGKLITVRPHTRFIHFPLHSHDYVEVVYMCRGSTVHYINGERVELKEGELLFLGQSAEQEIEVAGEEDIAVNLIVLPPFFDTALQMMGEEKTPLHDFIISCLTGNESFGYLHFQVADILPIQNLMENLIWDLIHDLPAHRNIDKNTMGLLFLCLLSYTDRLKNQPAEDEITLQVLRYIEEHYREGSLQECADLMHYDFTWLSREIKRRTGKNYTDLVQEKRLSQAAFLLRTTAMRVDDIGDTVGYQNMSYFHRIFEKKYGTTPRRYRMEANRN